MSEEESSENATSVEKEIVIDNEDKETKQLFEAAERNDLETVKKFIEEKGVQASIYNRAGLSIAHVGARNGNLDMVKYIVDKAPEVLGHKDRRGQYVLQYAVEKGHMDTINYLEGKYFPNISNLTRHDFESVAIHAAVQFDHLDIVKYFIEEKKCDVNIKDEWNEPPVFTAVGYKRPNIFEYLVKERKADLMIRDRYGEHILFEFIRTNDAKSLRHLLDEKKVPLDINCKNTFNDTMLHRAALLNLTDIIEYLVEEKHADVNIAGCYELTPLHCAALRNNYDLCKYFIEHGANPQAQDEKGETPAQKVKDTELAEYMTNVTMKRTRRSLDLYNGWSSSLNTILYGSNQQNMLGNASIDDSYSAQFSSLLMVAGSMIRSPRQRVRDHPSITLQNKFDPIAEEAVNNNQNFD